MNVGPCGIVCTICRYYGRGLCQGCVRGDLCPLERALLSPCPVLKCAAARKIPYCTRDCTDFPCALFERRFPRCWFHVASRRSGVTRLDEWEPAGLPMSATNSDMERPHWEGLRVFCLGPFRVYRGSEEIQADEWGRGRGPTQKIKAMFAYLLNCRKRGARKETLIDLLWPDETNYERANANFHPALHCLRRALEPDLRPGVASSYIRYDGQRYRLDPAKPYWVDVDVFETYCRRAGECDRGGDPDAAMLYWGMAIDLYGGDYMAGIHIDYTDNRVHDWCMPRRHRLRELYLTALLEMARYQRNVKEYGVAVKFAHKALDVEPAFEPAHQIAMQCLIEGGHSDGAIHQYRLCETELAWQEDRKPFQQTRLLYEQLIASSELQ